MFTSRAPKSERRREWPGKALRCLRRILCLASLVVATLTLVTFVTVQTSQACPGKNNPTFSGVTQNAPQLIAKQSLVASSVVKFAIKSTACCGAGLGHCHGFACGNSCCPACSTGLIAAGSTVTHSLILHVDILPVQTNFSSSEPDAQFRPPRISL
jgi:hypothetical protein